MTVQDAPFETPRASLIGFQTVSLQPGENRVISFRVQPEQLHVFKEDGSAVNAGGRHLFHVGGVSPGSRGEQLTGTKLLTATLDRN
ncbi:MAG: fibronectin type III-like domain-contianing protein [Xanthomonadales bacterium]|nr:fibronectin type III-like domain-contianing protein [Xanthomonadales bacterium]MDH3941969.1 fibronectin type III-like domain-contianing protein [Xanthomonadales bacterium]MDH4000948.1 fibronectin type III-like domain-contianing protein [Xanthomonadales bacterium]